ncbi:MAG: hypothetical protein GEU99_19620 [Luteitalea sp.]|nr:hypothetical protein [Luteitalea sp.]
MSDAGEGLVDAEGRLQEQRDAREHERRRRGLAAGLDPERVRQVESWRLARAEKLRQLESTQHPVRREQLALAIAELDRRLAE